MSVLVLRKLRAFVDGGGVVVGAPPRGPIGLSDPDGAFHTLRDALWKRTSATFPGSGYVIAGPASIDEALETASEPDVIVPRNGLDWKHRALADGDIYFFSNPGSTTYNAAVTLRAGAVARPVGAELWNAEDGSRVPLLVEPAGMNYRVRISLRPYSSRFVVLRNGGSTPVSPDPWQPDPIALDGPWRLRFLDGMGAPSGATVASLGSWTGSSNPAIRYYSGRATYSRDF